MDIVLGQSRHLAGIGIAHDFDPDGAVAGPVELSQEDALPLAHLQVIVVDKDEVVGTDQDGFDVRGAVALAMPVG